MKLLAVLTAALGAYTICAGSPAPMIPGDNSHYVEGKSRYIWMPDGKGVPHLVDLYERPSVEELQRVAKNGAENEYWLYTRQNPNSAQVLVHNNPNTIWASFYNGARPLKVIVHGWNNNGNSDVNPVIRDAFLAVQDCNVIVVDWRRIANQGYVSAVNGVPSVGQHIGHFLQWLINTAGGNWNNVHLVGYSLGAHIVGIAGRTVGNRPARITGLDPAGPLWGGNSNALRASDGQYVEAIHTDGGLLGIMDPIGRVNFYPNGGRNPQPGCLFSTCSHGRSYEYFAATIYHNHLIGNACLNVWEAELGTCSGAQLRMGNAILSKQGSGLYALLTTNRWPFGVI